MSHLFTDLKYSHFIHCVKIVGNYVIIYVHCFFMNQFVIFQNYQEVLTLSFIVFVQKKCINDHILANVTIQNSNVAFVIEILYSTV